MTCLLRCRGSTSEMAKLCAATPDAGLDWPAMIWTGEPVPVVIEEDGERRLKTLRWGLSAAAFTTPLPARQRGTEYARDCLRDGSRLADPAVLERCLILLEAFAYPMGEAGRRTRGWFGLWDHPLAAWAGVCGDGGCAGVLGFANNVVAPGSETMPLLLRPEDHQRWLGGGTLLSLGPGFADAEFYRENFGELWSTGHSTE